MDITLRGDETPEQINALAAEFSMEMVRHFITPDPGKREAVFNLARLTSIYTLANVVFNLAMNRSDGKMANISASVMIEMDEAKEEILNQVDFFISKVKSGEWQRYRPSSESPAEPEPGAHVDHSQNHKEP